MALRYPSQGRPLVLAHRGGGALALENSPTAFATAADLGITHIETDVRASADGVCVVIHDATLDRTTTEVGPVAGRPWADLRATALRNGDPLPSLTDMLARFPTLTWNVDVKDDHAVLPFLLAVGRSAAWDRVCVASFSGARLARLRRLAGPRLARATTPLEVATLRLRAGLRPRPGIGSPVAAQVPVRMRGVQVITRDFVARAHAAGVAVHAWTINDATQMAELLDLGVDGLVTDRPDVALDVVAAR